MRAALTLLLVMLAPVAAGALTGSIAFTQAVPFADGLGADTEPAFVSGAIEAELVGVTGAFGFFGVSEGRILGATRVCRGIGQADCVADPAGVEVRPGPQASVGLLSPAAVDGTFSAAHVLAAPIDFRGERDLASFELKRSLLAPTVDGRVRLGLPSIGLGQEALRLTGLDDDSVVFVDGEPVRGKTVLYLEGELVMEPFVAEDVIVPFQPGSTALLRATSEAREGVKVERVQRLLDRLTETSSDAAPVPEVAEEVLQRFMDGALLIPGGNLTFIRFDEARVEAGETLEFTGRGPLAVRGTEVQGARALVGFSWVMLPLFGFVLWGLAITAKIAATVSGAPKRHEKLDRFRLIGRLVGLAAVLLVLFLWDLETRSIWGASVLSSGLSGQARGFVALLQFGTFGFISLGIIAPLRMLVGAGLRLGRVGTLSGAAGPVAWLIGFFLGTLYYRSYIELLLSRVVEGLA